MIANKVSISKKIFKKLRTLSIDANYALLGRMPKTVYGAKGLRILVYHGICEDRPWLFNSRYLSVTQFEEHLQLITGLYHPVSLQDVMSGNLSVDKLNVLLTFDDGLKNNFSHAFPLLKKYKVPAVFFVTGAASASPPYLFNDLCDVAPLLISGNITIEGEIFHKQTVFLNQRLVNKDGIQLAHYFHRASHDVRGRVMNTLRDQVPETSLREYSLYYELMSDAELKAIGDHPDYEVGAHGFYHTDLSALPEKELDNELKRSIDYLKRILNKDVEVLAFPYGNYNQAVTVACEKHGFSHLFRTEKDTPVHTKARLLERFTVNPFVSAINQMYYIAKNNYE